MGGWNRKKILQRFPLVILLGLWLIPQTASEPISSDWALETLVRSCPTPDALIQFLQGQIRFEEDSQLFGTIEYWQEPEEFLTRRQGDCEDYALLAQAVLERQGIEAYVFSLYGEEDYAHTVCIFREGNRFSVINQDRLIQTNASTLQEVASQLNPRWTWGAIAAQQGHRGRALEEIYHSSNLLQASS